MTCLLTLFQLNAGEAMLKAKLIVSAAAIVLVTRKSLRPAA